MTPRQSTQSGFTIVELMTAMAFIAVLLLAIAGAVMQVGAIYNKGVTMKSVNQAGRVVLDDMKKAISESSPLAVEYVPQSNDQNTVIGGRLCTGHYSYIWNIGVHIDDNNPDSQKNHYDGAGNSAKPLRLVKVLDTDSKFCDPSVDPPILLDDSIELLSNGSVQTGDSQTVTGNLAVQDFHIERLTNNLTSDTALYSITIVISDADSKAVNTVDNSCRPPSEQDSDQQYCAVNEFTFTAQAGNGGAR